MKYYHCSNGCPERLSAPKVNTDFIQLFKNISSNGEIVELYSEILNAMFRTSDKDRQQMLAAIQNKIDRNLEKVDEAMDEWTDKKIDVTEFRAVKSRYEKLNISLMREKAKLQGVTSNGKFLKAVVEYLKKLDTIYLGTTPELKRVMVGSIFAEKLVYEKESFRAPVYTEIVDCMTQEDSELKEIKSGLHQKGEMQSRMVAPAGIVNLLQQVDLQLKTERKKIALT